MCEPNPPDKAWHHHSDLPGISWSSVIFPLSAFTVSYEASLISEAYLLLVTFCWFFLHLDRRRGCRRCCGGWGNSQDLVQHNIHWLLPKYPRFYFCLALMFLFFFFSPKMLWRWDCCLLPRKAFVQCQEKHAQLAPHSSFLMPSPWLRMSLLSGCSVANVWSWGRNWMSGSLWVSLPVPSSFLPRSDTDLVSLLTPALNSSLTHSSILKTLKGREGAMKPT